MSGFLNRLAAQTMGTKESTLHSVARLPYAIPPSPLYNDEAGSQTDPFKKRHPIADTGPDLNHVPSQNQPRDRFHAEIDEQALENDVIPSSPEVLIAQSATGFTTTTKPDSEIARPSAMESRLRQPEKSVEKRAAAESPVWDGVIKTHSPFTNSEAGSIVNDGSYSTFTDSTTPSPLLPLKNTAHPSALNSGTVAQRAMPRGSMWQTQVEETTEVHVSIGRIEVTAVHEAPTPKRLAPAATAKPMTLDEYLARRQRQA